MNKPQNTNLLRDVMKLEKIDLKIPVTEMYRSSKGKKEDIEVLNKIINKFLIEIYRTLKLTIRE